MKKARKLAALVLALMVAFSCMSMPAMAHEDEDDGIMPLYEAVLCPKCRGEAHVRRWYEDGEIYWPPANCSKSILAHLHLYDHAYVVRTFCMDCDYDVTVYMPTGDGICLG